MPSSLSADLSGTRVLITGASGDFGRHFAKVLSGAGASVLCAGRRLAPLRSLVQEIEASGGRAEALVLDVSSPESIRQGVAAAGEVHVLINNAGITNSKPALEQSDEDWQSIIDTNLRGAWLMATEVARRAVAAGIGCSIINVASILGLRQGGHVTPYAISKAAVIQMTKQLALELARHRVRVNALAPGYFATHLNREFFASDAGKSLVRRIPQRRLGNMEDLDGPLLLLASDASRFMTGSVLVVDGGHVTSQL